MGYSESTDDKPLMCFNAAKSWQLGWYSDRHVAVNPLTAGWSGRLVGISDYVSFVGDAVLVKINTSNVTDYYVNFNRMAGINSGTREGGNQVMIVSQGREGSGYSQSLLLAKLDAGNQVVITNFDDTPFDVVIKVAEINLSATPAYADIIISAPTRTAIFSSPTEPLHRIRK